MGAESTPGYDLLYELRGKTLQTYRQSYVGKGDGGKG
jgi:hypothetical protein